MKRYSLSLVAIVIACNLLACSSSGDRVDEAEGAVLLTITDFDGFPVAISVNLNVSTLGGFVQVGEITISNVTKNPNATTSPLQDVELDSYEVTFARSDSGTRLPPNQVRAVFGVVPVGGTDTLNNLVLLGPEQMLNPPLSDLLVVNGGVDSETGSTTIVLDVQFRFFGRTLSGDQISTPREAFTIEFLP
jgi:hypothetical protein